MANLVIDKDLGTNRVPYATFKALTDTRGMTTTDWCSTCNGTTWDPVNAPASCVRILLADAQASEASDDDDDDSKESQLGGAVAGLAVVLSVALVGLGVLLFQRRKRNQSKVGLLSNDNDSLTV